MVFFFTFALVVIPEVLVWSEHWKLYSFNGGPRDAAPNEEDVNSSTITRLELAMIFVHQWLNRFEAEEGSRLKFEKLGSVGGTAFGVNDERIIIWVVFTQSLPRYDIPFRLFLVMIR